MAEQPRLEGVGGDASLGSGAAGDAQSEEAAAARRAASDAAGKSAAGAPAATATLQPSGGEHAPTRVSERRISALAARSWPFVLACLVGFALEQSVIGFLGGHDTQSPLTQGLFSFREFYGYAVSTWPRALTPRYTVIVHIDPYADPTAKGLANNVCQQRLYLAKLLPAIAKREPQIVVVDKYFTRDGCTLAEPTEKLQAAVAEVTVRVPLVIGLVTDERAAATDAARHPPLLLPPLPFAPSPSLREGLVNRDKMARRVPLGWTVRPSADSGAEWRNSLALEAALVHEPKLFAKTPRLQDLKNERHNPYASMIGERLFNILVAADFLCTDKATAADHALACAQAKRSETDPSYVRGRIVIVGETGGPIDRHDSGVVGEVPGTVLQANYIEALLDERYFRSAPEPVNCVVGFLLFLALELSLRLVNPLKALGCTALVVIVTFGLLSLSARYGGYYVDPAVSALVLVFMLIRWITERIAHREKVAS